MVDFATEVIKSWFSTLLHICLYLFNSCRAVLQLRVVWHDELYLFCLKYKYNTNLLIHVIVQMYRKQTQNCFFCWNLPLSSKHLWSYLLGHHTWGCRCKTLNCFKISIENSTCSSLLRWPKQDVLLRAQNCLSWQPS